MDLISSSQVDPVDEPEYVNPHGCVAIVAVGQDGDYVMLEKPNLWMFDVESSPRDNGFGDELDLPPGVYRVTYSFHEQTDWESGCVDDWSFEPETTELLWSPESWLRRTLRAIHGVAYRYLIKLPIK